MDVLSLRGDVDVPSPGPGEIRMQVAAAGVGLPDVFMCRGVYALTPKLPFTPGQEAVGVVTEIGEGVSLQIGDRVMAVSSFMVGSGSFAEQCLAGADFAMVVPPEMSDPDAAGFLIPFHTAYVALVRRAALAAGESLLVLGAAGGSGSAAVALGRSLGARVIATAGGGDKAEFCRSLGADHVIDYREDEIAEGVREFTGGRGVDVVFDPVGGAAFTAATRCIAPEGRLLVIGFASGSWGRVEAPHLVNYNYSLMGVLPGRGYDRRFKEEAHAFLLERWRSGDLPVSIHGVYDFEEVPKAVDVLARGSAFGKVIVSL
ncbi:NADPH:quinone oxidoreductase family protein [Myxococcota bacterium]|nr:NADPH:quinone oxidoreductase family protein [Myxococcota bacterium]